MTSKQHREAINRGQVAAPYNPHSMRAKYAKLIGRTFTSGGDYRAFMNATADEAAGQQQPTGQIGRIKLYF